MIRDRGPLYNIGYGVSSRDLPTREGEEEGPSPGSGRIARALDNHPVMRFLGGAATAMAVTAVASSLIRTGGLKLGAKLDLAAAGARTDSFPTRLVRGILDLREGFDELQTVVRQSESPDSIYSQLVFKGADGKLTTGYEGARSERGFFRVPISKEGARTSGRGLTDESAEVWTYKDEIRKRLVRAGRRMPYELPALYVAQKGVSEPLFGTGREKKRVNWYNPADVLTDFVKTSTTNLATMILPFEGMSAAGAAGKSSLTTLASSMNDLNALSPLQRKAAAFTFDLKSLLAEVGHDSASIINKGLKISSQTSGAFSVGVRESRGSQPEFVQAARAARRGVKQALTDLDDKANVLQKLGARAKGFFTGETDEGIGALDAFPGLKGMRIGFKAAKNEFKALGIAHDVVSGKLTEQQALSKVTQSFRYNKKSLFEQSLDDSFMQAKLRGLAGTDARTILEKSINTIQSQHSSKVTRLAGDFYALGKGGPGSDKFTRSEFYQGRLRDSYKEQLENKLIQKNGIDKDIAKAFVNHIKIQDPPAGNVYKDISRRIQLGRSTIYGDLAESGSVAEKDEFFQTIIDRFQRVKGGKDFARAIGSGSALRQSLEEVDSLFISENFQNTLNESIKRQWNQVSKNELGSTISNVLKPSKQSYTDFVGELTDEKKSYLLRKTGKTLNIPITEPSGKLISENVLSGKIAQRGIDPTDFSYMRDYLLNNKGLTTGFFGGNTNIFGLKGVTIDSAMERGMFAHLSEEKQTALRQMASIQATRDPLTRGLGSATETLGQTTVGGVYETRSGEILDFTKVKSILTGAKNFIASEFRIPVIGFNPADMFGYRSFKAASEAPLLQYVSTRSVQPFLPKGETPSDFYLFAKTGASKGKLTSFSKDEFNNLVSSNVAGTYRPFPSSSMELISREARNAAGLTGENEQPKKLARFKKAFDVDTEQPNSVFRLYSRFKNRSSDINNPRTLSKILSSKNNEITIRENRAQRTLKLVGLDGDKTPLSIVDDLGAERYSQKQILSAVDRFRQRTFGAGTAPRLMRHLEETRPELFTSNGARASQIRSSGDFRNIYDNLMEDLGSSVLKLKNAGKDPRELTAAHTRLRKYLDESYFNSSSQLAPKSGVISTKLDEASNEVFRLISLKNQMLNDTQDVFTETTQAIRTLQKQGKIGLNDAIEARIAALGNLFNFSAFTTFKGEQSLTTNARESLKAVIGRTKSNDEIASLFTPFTSGSESMVGTTVKRPFSRVLPGISRRFGTAAYTAEENAVNALGNAQDFTFVPTFKTAFDRNTFGAIKSAVGIGTYKNQESFSTGSVPTSHLVGRVNKYFGTFGLQLDQSQYGGPIDMYMRGMVGKRVLPIVAGGTALFAADRTIGGYVNEKDKYGERVYSPYFTTKLARGIVEAQAIGAGLIPGGMSAEEKKEQLLEGEVPIKQGRFWPLGTTPFMGGKTMYYRPSYYRKLKEAGTYTSEGLGTPIERLAYNYDFSPLRPFDPYRFERQNYENRPYPVTGEYFTGPWGPATSLANMTIGKVLKPQFQMHQQELEQGLANYQRVGESGAYNTAAFSGPSNYGGGGFRQGGSYGSGGFAVGGYNSRMAQAAGPMATGSRATLSAIGTSNTQLRNSAIYGPPKVTGIMPPTIVPAGPPVESNKLGIQAGELGYRAQEMAGIYGFAFSSMRESMGLGRKDFEPQRTVLQSAAKGYGSSRSFWDLNLGGLGDVPMGGEGPLGNLEVSEIVRRFIPKERSGVNYINPIPNQMGKKYPFLPGAEYFTNFQTGDPYTRVPEGEIRLPGRGYERFNNVSKDAMGNYSPADQLAVLGDIAPYSKQYRSLNSQIQISSLNQLDQEKVRKIREQVQDTTTKYDFTPYKYKGTTPQDLLMHPTQHAISRAGEYIAHRDTFLNTKFLQKRTATEDWERRNVYGATFPEWQRPYESFIQPMVNKASQRNPIAATAAMAVAGSMFGRTASGKTLGTIIGAGAGLTSSIKGNLHEMITGDRFIPETRKKELALEEHIDILSYVKNTSLANQAKAAGDAEAAASFQSAAKRTMYGADLENGSLETLSLAVPKRKREHFKAMIQAPPEERERILSTAGRLERRIYESAWGMKVEEKPDLAEYFSRHELPSMNWEGWHPNTNMEHVKIKMGQSMGLEMSQMGYYPQQISEANLTNPSYPSFFANKNTNDTAGQLRAMMSRMGISGSVNSQTNPYGSNSININAGVR